MLALSTGSLLPFIKDSVGLSYAFAGFLVSLHSVGTLIAGFVFGAVSAVIGDKKSILLFDLFFPVSFLLILFGRNGILIAAAYLLTGIVKGANNNYCNNIISRLAPGRASLLNALHAMFSLGAVVFPLVLSLTTKNSSSGWIYSVYFMLFMGVISLAIYASCPEIKKEGGADDGKGKRVELGFLKEKIFYLVVFTLFFYLCAEAGVMGWLVTYFTDTGYISNTLSVSMAGIMWLMMLTGRLLTAFLSGKADKRKLLIIDGIGIVIFFILLLFSRHPVFQIS